MIRITPVDIEAAHADLRQNFGAIKQLLGMVPNMMSTMAVSPAVLEAYLAFSGALRRGVLPGPLQEQLAVAVAEANACDYCLSAHTALGARAGVAADELENNRDGRSDDPRTAAALRFASAVLDERGGVPDEALAEIRRAGFSDAAIAEIVAHVALNVFTNYFNKVAGTEIDFPVVTAKSAAA